MPLTESRSSGLSSTSLILRLQDGDNSAWQELVELYGSLIFGWCQRCQLNSADSADVMQEVLLSVARGVARFERKAGSSFRGWLWTITRNKIRDLARRRRKHEIAAGGTTAMLMLAELEQLEEDPTTDPQSHQLLHRALDQIKPRFGEKTWQAFWRTVVDGQPTDRVADELAMTSNRVRQSKSRVLRRLREQLGDC